MNKKPVVIFELLIALIILTAGYLTSLEKIPFKNDETHWISYSALYEPFLAGNFDDPLWKHPHFQYFFSPPTYYVIGAARNIGGFAPDDFFAYYDNSISEQENREKGQIPPDNLLWWARAGITTTSVIAIFILFVILWQSTGRFVAYFWLASTIISPYLSVILRRAMNEGPLLLGICLAILTATQAIKVKTTSKWLFWVTLTGLSIGWATSTKINGAAALIGVLLLFALDAIRKDRDNIRKNITKAIAGTAWASLISFFLFVWLNPFLHSNPIGNSFILLQKRSELMAGQQKVIPNSALYGIRDRLDVIPESIFLRNNYLSDILPTFVLFLIGCVFLTGLSKKWFKYSGNLDGLASLVIIGGISSLPALFTPLNWNWYFMLPVIFSMIIIGYGIQFSTELLFTAVKQRFPEATNP